MSKDLAIHIAQSLLACKCDGLAPVVILICSYSSAFSLDIRVGISDKALARAVSPRICFMCSVTSLCTCTSVMSPEKEKKMKSGAMVNIKAYLLN